MSNLLHRSLKEPLPLIEHGMGVRLYDSNGKEYIDGSSGAFVVSLGHSNAEVLKSYNELIQKITYVNGTQFTNENAEDLAKKLCEKSKKIGLNRCGFISSGSEAVEAALKLARQIHIERGEKSRKIFISRTPSYHGNTLFALSASGRPGYKKNFSDYLVHFESLTTPYEYVALNNITSNSKTYLAEPYLDELSKKIASIGKDNIAGLILEPISGSSVAGALPPSGYLKGIEKICKANGILTIADEVLVGMGRTGTYYASEHDSFNPDFLTLGKGLNGGLTALSAVLTREEHFETIRNGSKKLDHAQTFMHCPGSVAAGIAVFDYFEKHLVLKNVIQIGDYLNQKLRSAFENHDHVGFISNIGLLFGIEIVENKSNKSPFPIERKITEKLTHAALESGLTLWPNTGHRENGDGDIILLGPPLVLNRSEADEIVTRLLLAFDSVF